MSYCITEEEYERRTYSKEIGLYTLTCERAILKDETEVSPEEETEALEKLEEIITFLKEHLYIHSLRRASPIIVKVKSGKEILFEFNPKYWDDYYEVLVKIGEEQFRLLDEAKALEELQKETASKVQETEIVVEA